MYRNKGKLMKGQNIVTKNEKETERFVLREMTVPCLTDSLTGILKGNTELNEAKSERMNEKY